MQLGTWRICAHIIHMVNLCMTHAGKLALRGRTVVAGSGDAGYTNVGEEGNDISDTDPDCSVARPFYPSNRLVFVELGLG